MLPPPKHNHLCQNLASRLQSVQMYCYLYRNNRRHEVQCHTQPVAVDFYQDLGHRPIIHECLLELQIDRLQGQKLQKKYKAINKTFLTKKVIELYTKKMIQKKIEKNDR